MYMDRMGSDDDTWEIFIKGPGYCDLLIGNPI